MALTPDQLTVRYWQDAGYRPIKVEKWNLYPHPRRSDFLGIFDYLCLKKGEVIAVQTTTKSNFSARRHKMLKAKTMEWWLETGNKAILQVWGKKDGRWEDRTVELTMDDWKEYQADMKAKYDKMDTDSPLYKDLFGEKNDS